MDQLSRLNFAFSVANNELGPKGAKILADMLHVNSSMTKLNIWDSNIGVEGATAIVNAAPTQMRTLCGDMFEEGQTEADLSGKKLGAEGAILVAWDLRAGFVSSSMTFLNLADNALCGLTVMNKGTLAERIEGTYDSTGIKAIADALNVNTSMKSLK